MKDKAVQTNGSREKNRWNHGETDQARDEKAVHLESGLNEKPAWKKEMSRSKSLIGWWEIKMSPPVVKRMFNQTRVSCRFREFQPIRVINGPKCFYRRWMKLRVASVGDRFSINVRKATMRRSVFLVIFLTLPIVIIARGPEKAKKNEKIRKTPEWSATSTTLPAVVKNVRFALSKVNDDRKDTYVRLITLKKAEIRTLSQRGAKHKKDYRLRLRIQSTKCSKAKKNLSFKESQHCQVDKTKVSIASWQRKCFLVSRRNIISSNYWLSCSQ